MTDHLLLKNARLPEKKDLLTISITNGAIIAIQPTKESAGANYYDLDGAFVLPGMCDAHLHLEMLSIRLSAIDCELPSKRDCLAAVAKAAEQADDDSWLIGFNWNHNVWQPAEYGTAEDLDRVSANHPVLLYAKSLHASWANSKALQAAGINQSTPDPVGGQILRDESGNPTGILLENAMQLAEAANPPLTTQELAEKMLATQSYLHSLGLTSVHDFDRFESLEALELLASRGLLTLDVTKNLPAEAIDRIIRSDYRDHLSRHGLTPGWIKGFADGALGPQSAAMLEPYENSVSKGMLLLKAAEILELGIKAAQAGWPLAIHAIGDAANHEVLEGYARLREAERHEKLPHLPHRIEHAQCLHPHDFTRFKQFGVIASVQPIHAVSDRQMALRNWGGRIPFAYAYRSLEEAGATMVFGTDAPVEPADPFLGLRAAVDRPSEEPSILPEGWPISQSVTLSTVLHAYAQAPALLTGRKNIGKIEPGYLANLITLPVDPFQCDPAQLGELKPLQTYVRGRLVYDSL